MKLKKTMSQYSNPDRLIKTLRKRIEIILRNSVKTMEMFKEYRNAQVANAPKPVIFWEDGNFEEQSVLALCPTEIHVGKTIVQIGRIVQVIEKLNEKGRPVTLIKYELKQTKLQPSIITIEGDPKSVKA